MNVEMEIAVVGVTHEGRQEKLATLFLSQERGEALRGLLSREPGNTHDPNAIKVLVSVQSHRIEHVGYVARALAASLAPRMDAGDIARVTRVKILEGKHEYRVTYGVRATVSLGPRPAQQTQAFEVLR